MENNSNKTKGAMLLPSQHQINDFVKLDFDAAGHIIHCKVIKIHFTESKVLYDVLLTNMPTRLYNIESDFVFAINEKAKSLEVV